MNVYLFIHDNLPDITHNFIGGKYIILINTQYNIKLSISLFMTIYDIAHNFIVGKYIILINTQYNIKLSTSLFTTIYLTLLIIL